MEFQGIDVLYTFRSLQVVLRMWLHNMDGIMAKYLLQIKLTAQEEVALELRASQVACLKTLMTSDRFE